jgi:hypothetical protein
MKENDYAKVPMNKKRPKKDERRENIEVSIYNARKQQSRSWPSLSGREEETRTIEEERGQGPTHWLYA